MMNRHKKAITLVEILIAVVICATLFAGLMKLLSSGMKGSTKGLAHQANMEAATILMSQIEYDLLRTSSLEIPPVNEKADTASWHFYNNGILSEVKYTKNLSSGVDRAVKAPNGKTQEFTFAKGLDVDISFYHFVFTSVPKKYFDLGKIYRKKHAIWVELIVSNKQNKKVGEVETITLRRLVVVKS